MRASAMLVLMVMGVLSIGIALVSSRIYRDHAYDTARAALNERLHLAARIMQERLNREAEATVQGIAEETLPGNGNKNRSLDHRPRALDRAWNYYTGSDLGGGLVQIALYDKDFQLLGKRTNGSLEVMPGELESVCGRPSPQASSAPASTGILSGYCLAGQRLYYRALVPIGRANAGYAQIISDVLPVLQATEGLIGLPLRIMVSDGSTIHQSDAWSPLQAVGKEIFTASMPIELSSGDMLHFQIARDERALYARLEQTRSAVLFAVAAMTLLVVLLALALLERTVVGPVHALMERLRNQQRDQSQLGNRVRARGNAEAVQLAACFNDMTDKLEGLYKRLEQVAFTDPLTHLPNRNFFYGCLERAIAQAQQENRTFALFIMDLDRFKEINDTLSHHIGDLLLQQVAARLRDKLRDSDTIARMGGDEFAVLLPTVTAKQADMAARMLVQSLRSPFIIEAHQLDVGTSIGIALYPDHGVDVHTLIQRADVAMYAAKQAGGGHTFYDAEMDRHNPAQLTLMGELRQAVEQEQFVLYYQPKIGLKTNRVIGVEALVRWRHPSGRLIMPETFIPLLEQTGLIRGLTGWVTHEALRMAGELRLSGFDLPIAVNISARDLQNSGLAEELAEQLEVHQAAAQWLELEITESAVMSDVTDAHDLLTRLAEMGFKVLIDDFGTGYSSLAYLKRLPVHAVKIDKSFVMGMARDENDAAIVFTSIDLSHNLGLQVVAEGVDDEGVLLRLRSRGCDAVQGMYLSRPLSAEELTDWLEKSTWGLPARVAC